MEDILNAGILDEEIIICVWRMGLCDLRRDRAPVPWSSRKEAGSRLGVRWDLGRCLASLKNSLLPVG